MPLVALAQPPAQPRHGVYPCRVALFPRLMRFPRLWPLLRGGILLGVTQERARHVLKYIASLTIIRKRVITF